MPDSTSTGINDVQTNNASAYKLIGNYPNPFNPSTTIEFTIPSSQKTSVAIYDILGREIRTLYNKQLNGGSHSVVWDGKDNTGSIVNSGIYIYRIKTADKTLAGKMILQK